MWQTFLLQNFRDLRSFAKIISSKREEKVYDMEKFEGKKKPFLLHLHHLLLVDEIVIKSNLRLFDRENSFFAIFWCIFEREKHFQIVHLLQNDEDEEIC